MSLYFTKDHEWVNVDGDHATVGISDHAQQALGDIVFAEVPDAGFGALLNAQRAAAGLPAATPDARLTAVAQANPFTLSGGQKRRLSVATVLATRPRLLVLDEPTFGQDSRTWAELVALFAELVEDGSGLVMMTHDRELVDALADTTVQLP